MMKITDVRINDIMRSKIYPAAKPPGFIIHFEITDIHVNYRYKRIVRMHHNRNTSCEEIIAFNLESLFYSFRQFPVNSRKINPALFDHISMLHNSCTAATSAIPVPDLLFE